MTISLWIGNLGKYNEGKLVGEWVQLPLNESEWHELFVDIKLGHWDENDEYVHGYYEDWNDGSGFGSFYEEWYIGDTDIEFPFKVDIYDDIYKLNDLAEMLEGKNDCFLEVFFKLYEDNHGDFDNCYSTAENGRWWNGMDMSQVTREYLHECYDVPAGLERYIDYGEYQEMLESTGEYLEFDWGVFEIC